MGLEAISRGACQCCFVEKDRAVAQRLRRNIETVGAGDICKIKIRTVERQLKAPFAGLDSLADIAFVDPPYAIARKWDFDRAIRTLFTPLAQHLAPGGVVILRLPDKVELPDTLGPLSSSREKNFGDMKIVMLKL